MKSPIAQHLPGGSRYPASTGRILLLALFVSFLYAAGLGAGGWAATVSLAAVRAGGDVPWAPWLLAFVFMVSGMLAVVYGFFFRPRALEISPEEVALVRWDGKGRSMRRAEVTSVRPGRSRIVLEGSGKRLAIAPIFSQWEAIGAELAKWTRAGEGP
jgi:hypothetical protein